MTDWLTGWPFGMSREEILVVLDRNVSRAAEIRKQDEVRRAAELAAAARKKSPSPATPSRNAKPAKPRIGPKMRAVVDYVSAVPGCSKREATLAAGAYYNEHHGEEGPVERAIRAGLLIVEYAHPWRCRLFISERDRRRWHLAREIMTPGIPAERVAEIRAEIAALDAERAATWSTS